MQLMGVWSASVSSAPHYLQIQYCLFKHSEQRRGFFCLNQAALLLFMEPGYTSQCFSPAQLLILSVSSQTNYRKSCIWSKYKDNDAGEKRHQNRMIESCLSTWTESCYWLWQILWSHWYQLDKWAPLSLLQQPIHLSTSLCLPPLLDPITWYDIGPRLSATRKCCREQRGILSIYGNKKTTKMTLFLQVA